MAGLTIGPKAIVQLGGEVLSSTTVAVRLNCTHANQLVDDVYGTTIATLSLHKLSAPPVPKTTKVLGSYRPATGNDTAPCAFRDCGIYTGAGYKLVRQEAVVLGAGYNDGPDVARLHLVYNIAVNDNGLADDHDAKYAPPGYVDETSTGEEFWVFASPGPGRVPIFEYVGHCGLSL